MRKREMVRLLKEAQTYLAPTFAEDYKEKYRYMCFTINTAAGYSFADSNHIAAEEFIKLLRLHDVSPAGDLIHKGVRYERTFNCWRAPEEVQNHRFDFMSLLIESMK